MELPEEQQERAPQPGATGPRDVDDAARTRVVSEASEERGMPDQGVNGRDREPRTARDRLGGNHAGWKTSLQRPDAIDKEEGKGDGGSRMHVVFVPGFGGFDALGSVNYYTGTTEAAKRWRGQAGRFGDRVVLQYFDNLPTAGVTTRAERLLSYLLRRVERNEFREGDGIALVGHSTGGLDIRCMLLRLEQMIASADGRLNTLPSSWRLPTQKFSCPEIAAARDLRKRIQRVVFLSVPNRGTNIANWVRAWAPLRIPLVSAAAFLVDASDIFLVQPLDVAVTRYLEGFRPLHPGGLAAKQALIDTWVENAQRTSADPVRAARGREALSKLTLYLSHTHGDFLAIDDLAAFDPNRSRIKRFLHDLRRLVSNVPLSEDADNTQLARASEADRQIERQLWLNNGIEVLSFATLGAPGLPADRLGNDSRIPVLRALKGWLWSPPGLQKTDGLYRMVYAACAHGPFVRELERRARGLEPDKSGTAHELRDGVKRQVEAWENDGIVNTASMLWPNGEDTLLVHADHGDIIGHYTPAIDPEYPINKRGRKYRSYDFFASDSKFSEAEFDQVWARVFDFCVAAMGVNPP